MFEPTSRYHAIPTATHIAEDGREIVYKLRRFLPRPGSLPELQEITVSAADRPDLIAARTLGDPERYWQIADANNVMHPAELTAEPDRRLRIALPGSDA